MEKTGSPKLLFANVDFKPIRNVLWIDLHLDGPGRPVVYDLEWDLRALMLLMLLQLRYVKDLVRLLRRSALARMVLRPLKASCVKRRTGLDPITHFWL